MAVFGGLVFILIMVVVFTATMIASRNKSDAEKKNIRKSWLIIIGIFISIPILLYLIKPLWEPMYVSQRNNYGEYVIDREMFKGKQADWQYNHYRFEIKDDNTFLFYVTNKEKIIKTYRGTVTYIAPRGQSYCIAINMKEPRHHILESNPTMYRNVWSFYYVFKSDYYGNMFFKKGEWEEIDD